MKIAQTISRKIPGLALRMKQAGIYEEPEDYIKRTLFTSGLFSFGLALIVFTFLQTFTAFILIPIFFPILFLYFVKYVDVKIDRLRKKIDQEIIFAGRFLIIELESGVPIYKIFEDMEKNYDVVGYFFGDIIDKVYLGTSIEDAINDTLSATPSANLRRILWQILNSLRTGTEISESLNSVIDQIVKEQNISVQEYGKKLSPLAMFYMMISIILPSLGITMLVVMATFMGLNITMPFFVFLVAMIGVVQFFFLSMVRTQRPAMMS